VVQVAEEFIEAMHARKVLVQVAEVVLAELTRGVAHRFQHRGDGRRLRRQADIGAGLADRRQSSPDRQLAGDEIGAACGAARFGIIVGEAHALRRQLVKVGRFARHDALVVGADVEPADIVTHDEQDIRPLLLGLSCGWDHGDRQQRDCDQEHRAADRIERPQPCLTRCLRVRGRLATHDVSSSSFGLVVSRGRHPIRRESLCNP
jgi:hypothetical protein